MLLNYACKKTSASWHIYGYFFVILTIKLFDYSNEFDRIIAEEDTSSLKI